jgi:hypothetical protein
VQTERHRARRYPFRSNIELTDVQSELQLRQRTSDLSLFGCFVETPNPWPTGTKVSIKIVHRGVNFQALGKVAYARANAGMGIVFTNIPPKRSVDVGDMRSLN